jgi:hypothetical protein
MEETQAEKYLKQIPEEARKKLTIDNEGNLVSNNRAMRRKKPPADNWYTKNTNRIQKKRKKIRDKIKHNRRSAEA